MTNTKNNFYGINIYSRTNFTWERLNTYNSLEEAQTAYNILCKGIHDSYIYVQLEQVTTSDNNEYHYKSLYSTLSDEKMKDEKHWESMIHLNPAIHDFTVHVDECQDGKIVNICWLKLGYYSPASEAGYFHFVSLDDFDSLLADVRPIKTLDHDQLSSYLYWLSNNEVLFDKNSRLTQIEQIARVLE